MTSDDELLRAFARDRDDRAFRQIVERYLGAVYAAARRQLGGGVGGDTHLADDVTQAVCIMLARKAAGLRDGTLLAGWLVNAARFTARTAARSESRRKRHVQRIADMTPRNSHTPAGGDNGDEDDALPNTGTSCGVDLDETALWGAAATTALLLLLSAALLLVARHGGPRAGAPPVANAAGPAGAATRPAALRVGVYVSANTGVQALEYDKDRNSMTRGLRPGSSSENGGAERRA